LPRADQRRGPAGNRPRTSGKVMSNRQLVFEDFADKVEQIFVISD
jgi:hypothetical protein